MQLLSLRNALPMPLYSLDQGYMPPLLFPQMALWRKNWSRGRREKGESSMLKHKRSQMLY
jgi:hypothetical protein